MKRIALLIEWDEDSALHLAELVWNAGGAVTLLPHPLPEPLLAGSQELIPEHERESV